MALSEDPLFANVSTSEIHPSNSNETNDNPETTTDDANPGDLIGKDINLDSESLAEFQRELQEQ